jgi:hypothetical protein
VIVRLIGLCLLVLSAWPASAEVRLEGAPQAAAKWTRSAGAGRFVRAAVGTLGVNESEREAGAPAFAAADADEPKTLGDPDTRGYFIRTRWVADGRQACSPHAPRSHRACAAPPTGPPAG